MASRAVFITGAAVRVGRQIALTLAGKGYDIALHYHRSEEAAEQTRQEIQALGRRCELFACDLRQVEAFDGLLAQVFEAFPACDALVNNASIFDRMPFLDTSETFFDAQFTLNFKAPFFLTQAFAKRQPDCSVVNIVDSAAAGHATGHMAYLLSKKALLAFTPMAARSLAPRGRVNAVLPGTVLPSEKDDPAHIEKLKNTLPAGRLATPEELAEAVYQALEQTALNGQCLFIDGGGHLL